MIPDRIHRFTAAISSAAADAVDAAMRALGKDADPAEAIDAALLVEPYTAEISAELDWQADAAEHDHAAGVISPDCYQCGVQAMQRQGRRV